jgi:O-antigen/teichoic acid export membrane protein
MQIAPQKRYMNKIRSYSLKLLKNDLFRNSSWGVIATVLQSVFVSLLFVIMANHYVNTDFAHFLIASTVYQIIGAFSSMGLGQWFIRELNQDTDKGALTSKFIKIQTALGLAFYLVNIVLTFVLYPDVQVRWLSIILGANIVFDNIIYAIKNLNIAELQQKKTMTILFIDGFLRFALGCVLFIYPISILTLSVITIALRFFTVNLFMKVGSSNSMSVKKVWQSSVVLADIKAQIVSNWQFVVIGSLSIVYWRLANVFIAKALTLTDVANYEISYRIFSIAFILPAAASATFYAQFIKLNLSNDKEPLNQFYKQISIIYSLFGILCFAFIYSFSDIILIAVFGERYRGSISCLKEMFLTMLVFPSVFLQASLIVAIKHEKIDMYLNILSLAIHLIGCWLAITYFKSLAYINYSIFGSILVFHISQNAFLVKQGINTLKNCLMFYVVLAVFIAVYPYLSHRFNPYLIFLTFCSVIVAVGVVVFQRYQKISGLTISTIKI